MSDTEKRHPSLVGAHSQYIKGAAESAIGSILGSKPWTQSGAQDKENAINDMKAASSDRDAQKSGFGKAEEVAGKVVGCEGMQNEGAESQAKE